VQGAAWIIFSPTGFLIYERMQESKILEYGNCVLVGESSHEWRDVIRLIIEFILKQIIGIS
jgi:hypothetical protein